VVSLCSVNFIKLAEFNNALNIRQLLDIKNGRNAFRISCALIAILPATHPQMIKIQNY
jgi:hypothetical protein